MMKKRNLLHSGVLALLLASCSTTPQSGKQEGVSCPDDESVTVINLTNPTDSVCLLSDIGENIEYYPLVTDGKVRDIELLPNYIGVMIADDSIKMQLFDRKQLHLINEVMLGKGQNIGYAPTFKFSNTSFIFNEEDKFIITYRALKRHILHELTANDGVCSDSIKEPKGVHVQLDFWALSDSTFVKDYLVLQEIKQPSIKWFDRNQKFIKEDLIPDSVTRSNYHSLRGLSCPFNLLGDKIYFHTDLMPTIYEVSPNTSPKAIYKFELGRYSPELYKLKDYEKKDESPYILIADSKISDNFVFGEYCYQKYFYRVLFDKNSFKKWIIPTNMELMDIRNNHSKVGIKNDLDGGFDFWPRRVSKNGEIYTWYNVEDLRKKVQQSVSKQMKNPEATKRLKEMLNGLPEDVKVIVAVLKEK